MRLQLATSLLAGGSVAFASVVDANRIDAFNHANRQHEIRTQGGGGRWAKRQQMRRQARRLKSTLKVDDDLGHLLKVDQEDQQAGEDVGILYYHKAGDTRDNSVDPSSPRFLQDRDFCECVEDGYAVEEEQCFDTAVAGCKLEGPYANSPPTGCGGPYIASYCQYYECLDGTFGTFDAFQAASNEDQQACMCAYYASICYLCTPRENGEDPLIDPDDDFCESSNAYCQVAACCEEASGAGEKSACIDSLDEGGDNDGPTFEPTKEVPNVGVDSVEPTSSSPTVMKAEDTPVPTTAVTVTQPSPEEIASPTSVPPAVFITSSPTEDDDTTSSPTGVPDVPTSIPTAQPTEVIEAVTDAPTGRRGGETTPSPEPTLPESSPSTSDASLMAGSTHAASVVCLAIALVGYVSLVF